MSTEPQQAAPPNTSWTRIWMGAILIFLITAVLVFDPAPWYPFLILLIHLLALVSTIELEGMLPPSYRPPRWSALAAVQLVLLANWPAHLLASMGPLPPWVADPWKLILALFVVVVLGSLLLEMASFREAGLAISRSALLVWQTAYLGLLPAFLAQQRWLGSDQRGAVCLAMTIFVAKSCDIGAYFTGRMFGRHRMSPLLSPKKTWEGLAGGMVLSVLIALAFQWRFGALHGGTLAVIGFGITVGGSGVLGDLAESLIKRDGRQKDASQVVPGFGGVLDVIDSLLFAAPVAYCWLSW